MIKLKKILLESEPGNSDEWEDWWQYIEYFRDDMDPDEIRKLIKKYNLDGKTYLGGKIVQIWDKTKKTKSCYLYHDFNYETVSLITDIEDWVYTHGEDELDIDPTELYNGWTECTLKDLRSEPGMVYHYTTDEKWELIQQSGKIAASGGTGLTNRNEFGVFTSVDPEEYALGTYGEICLEINLEQFKIDSQLKELDLNFEPEVIEFLIREYIRHKIEIEDDHDSIDISGGMSPYTVIVGHAIPIKYIKQIK